MSGQNRYFYSPPTTSTLLSGIHPPSGEIVEFSSEDSSYLFQIKYVFLPQASEPHDLNHIGRLPTKMKKQSNWN